MINALNIMLIVVRYRVSVKRLENSVIFMIKHEIGIYFEEKICGLSTREKFLDR